jgi:CDP-diacylglycerol--glycerol-3-phosphate 3-phosphatidyltransferase
MIGLLKKSLNRLPDTMERGALLNVPNTITMLRVTIIPVLFFLLLSPGQTESLVIATFFVLAALTDLLDGYLARKYEIVTVMGKYLDPIADKLIINTAMTVSGLSPHQRASLFKPASLVSKKPCVKSLRYLPL